jgi:multidrug efflux pump subunit AcrB
LIEIPSSGYNAQEGYEYIVKSLENKIYELPGIDDVYGYTADGAVSVMVAFKVGIKQEDAKTRLYDKMYSNMDLKPYGIENIQIRSIDPEDLPQVTYAITYSGSDLDTVAR